MTTSACSRYGLVFGPAAPARGLGVLSYASTVGRLINGAIVGGPLARLRSHL